MSLLLLNYYLSMYWASNKYRITTNLILLLTRLILLSATKLLKIFSCFLSFKLNENSLTFLNVLLWFLLLIIFRPIQMEECRGMTTSCVDKILKHLIMTKLVVSFFAEYYSLINVIFNFPPNFFYFSWR